MFAYRSVPAIAVFAALLGLLMTAGAAQAQPAGPQGMGWISGGAQVPPSVNPLGSPDYYPSGEPTEPSSPEQPGYQSFYPPLPGYQSFYPTQPGYQSFYPSQPGNFGMGGTSSSATVSRPVMINVVVPPDAQIWFDGVGTTQAGGFRQFVSPPLTPGREFSYEVKASWKQNGKEVVQTRHVPVHAGDVVNVTFQPRTENGTSAQPSASGYE